MFDSYRKLARPSVPSVLLNSKLQKDTRRTNFVGPTEHADYMAAHSLHEEALDFVEVVCEVDGDIEVVLTMHMGDGYSHIHAQGVAHLGYDPAHHFLRAAVHTFADTAALPEVPSS